MAEQELDAPDGSVQVTVTVLVLGPNGPVGLTVQLIGSPSGSNDPLSTSASVKLPRHMALAEVEKFLHSATGGLLGATVIPTDADGIPLTTTTRVLGPFSRLLGVSKWVVTTSVLPTASTPIRL